MNQSALFTAYNAARRLAREGKLDASRLNRALGVAQSKAPSRYVTTAERCSCPDSQYRKATCKHQLALALKEVATW